MRYGFDVSHYIPAPTADVFSAIVYSERIGKAVLAADAQTLSEWLPLCQNDSHIKEIEYYQYINDPNNLEAIIDGALANLSNAGVAGTEIPTLWLDIEAATTPAPTFVQLSQAIAYAKTKVTDVGIYTVIGEWDSIGNPQIGSLCRLWNADYSQSEPYTFGVWYGGWIRAIGIQYAGNYQTFGVVLDMSVWDD